MVLNTLATIKRVPASDFAMPPKINDPFKRKSRVDFRMPPAESAHAYDSGVPKKEPLA
jgi:hypothetical protein